MEFKQVIKMYLDVQSMSDAEFKDKYANESKSIDECCLYIQSEMLKRVTERKDAACVVPTDEEVFALAVRYYMDDDIKVDGSEFNNVKVLSMSATTFTDEEKKQMREEAIEEYKNEIKKQERKNDTKKTKEKKPAAPVLVPDTTETKKEEKPVAQQLSLF